MSRSARVFTSSACLAALFLAASQLPSHATSYSFQDLGYENGYAYGTTAGTCLNDNAVVAGHTGGYQSSLYDGFIWQSGTLTVLPEIGGSYNEANCTPTGVNSSNVVVGDIGGDIEAIAFQYKNGTITELDTDGPGASASGINNAGQIVGQDGNSQPYVYQNGAETVLRLPSGLTSGNATCINNAGTYEAAGVGTDANSNVYAVLWSNGTPYKLGELGGSQSAVTGINDQGEIVGTFETNTQDSDGNAAYHAFLWKPGSANGISGTFYDLGVLTSGDDSQAASINNADMVVGTSGSDPFIWTTSDGMQALAPMITSAAITGISDVQGLYLDTAAQINNTGQITGKCLVQYDDDQGRLGEAEHGYLLTPSGGGSGTAAALASVSLSPSSVTGGLSSTGTVTLTAAAPAGGDQVSLSSSAGAVTVPSSVTVAAGATSATFTAKTSSVSSSTSVTITAAFGSVSKTATLKLTSPSLTGVSLSPATVAGGAANATGTVTLNVAAPSAGTTITLSSSNTSALSVPSSVTVPSGKTSATFTATSYAVSSSTSVTVTATRGSTSFTAKETVNPVSTTPAALSSLSFSPSSVTGGLSSTGTVTLAAAAPSGGEKVTLSSGASSVSVPSSVTVAAGATTATFTATTSPVSSSTSVTITASANGASKTATLKLTSPSLTGVSLNPTSIVGGSANATGTVTINAPAPSSGVSITLSSSNTGALSVPSSVTVASGKTSATFTATSYAVSSSTSVTVAATRGSTSFTAKETVNPASAQSAKLSSYSFSPSTVKGGNTSTATVTLTGPAPSGGASVAITFNGGAWYTLNIAAGQTSGTYSQPTSATSSTLQDTFTATYNGTSKSATLTITP